MVLHSRWIDPSVEMLAPPSQRDLLTTGLRRFAGGVALAGAAKASIVELNHSSQTLSWIMVVVNITITRNWCYSYG